MDSVTFLQLITRNITDGYLELSARDDGRDLRPSNLSMYGKLPLEGAERLAKLRAEIHRLNVEAQYGLHFCPGILRAPKDRWHRATKEDIQQIGVLWGDIDGVSLDEGRDRLHALDHEPSLVFHSGGGIHFYYLLKSPVSVDAHGMNLIERTLKGIAKLVGGDAQVGRVNNNMRLPFSVNQKPKRNGHVVALIASTETRYDYAELEISYAPLVPPPMTYVRRQVSDWTDTNIEPPGWVKNYLRGGAAEGFRNKTLFSVASWYASAGLDISKAQSELMAVAIADGMKPREAAGTIRSAYKQPRQLAYGQRSSHTYMQQADRILQSKRREAAMQKRRQQGK